MKRRTPKKAAAKKQPRRVPSPAHAGPELWSAPAPAKPSSSLTTALTRGPARQEKPGAAAILLAAGRGSRMRGAVADKVLAPLAGRAVFLHSVEAFLAAQIVDRFVVVFRDEAQRRQLARLWPEKAKAAVSWIRGGDERQDSVAHALDTLENDVELVFIHDCARPLVRAETLRELAAAVRRDGAACLAHRVTDTIKQLPAGAVADVRPRRLRTLDRERLWAMETPQAFSRALIADAYRTVRRRRWRVTDDAAAIERATRHGVTLIENPHPNPKLTRPGDLALAEFLCARERPQERRHR